jgi:hypothetical protein
MLFKAPPAVFEAPLQSAPRGNAPWARRAPPRRPRRAAGAGARGGVGRVPLLCLQAARPVALMHASASA